MNVTTQEVRDRLLAILLEEPGAFLSGEGLSKSFGMTRAAVWKHMQHLQQTGWPIESVPRKGYCMAEQAVLPYSAAGIRTSLRQLMQAEGESAGIPWDIQWRAEVDSTSTRLKELAAEGAPEGLALFADAQTGGRGRMGRQWSSMPGLGTWMSVLLRPDMAPAEVQSLTLAASVAVVQALRAWLRELPARTNGEITGEAAETAAAALGIKWPNDILWKGRKLCGILTELAAEPDRLSHVVLGIGVNVAHDMTDFPPELRETAISLARLPGLAMAGTAPDRNRIAAHLLRHLSTVLLLHRNGGIQEILAAWRQASVTLGREIRVMDPAGAWLATALDIGGDGRLRVRDQDGGEHWLLSGEISIRPLLEAEPTREA